MASESGAKVAVAAGDALTRAHAQLLKDHTLQFAFGGPEKPPPPPPGWLTTIGKILGAIAPLMQYVFWAGVAIGVIALLVFIGREIIAVRWPGLKRVRPAKLAEPEWRPAPEKAKALLEDADRLAAAGRFAEAAHLLLHRSIEDLEGRRPSAVRPALTSRDIAALPNLPDAARGPFRLIAEVVERSFFGGRPVDADAFARCRSAYESFALPEAWA
jgi:hypothetical protein